MSQQPRPEQGRLEGHFVVRCPGGHKVAEVLAPWVPSILCRCRHLVRVDHGRLAERFARCPNGHIVAEVTHAGIVILCRCRRLVRLNAPGAPADGKEATM